MPLTRSALFLGAGATVALGIYLQPEPTTVVSKPWRFSEARCVSNTPITSDTNKLVFALPKPLGGHTAQSVLVRTAGPSGRAARPYSPIESMDNQMTLVVKKYQGGKSSTNLHALQEGQTVKVSGGGPLQKFRLKTNQFPKIALIAGGSGITPVYQLLNKVAHDVNDTTQVDLYYSSKSEIILKPEIDALVALKPEQLRVHYVDRIDYQFLDANLDKTTNKVFVCGPPGMYKSLSGEPRGPFQGRFEGALKDLGFSQNQVYKF